MVLLNEPAISQPLPYNTFCPEFPLTVLSSLCLLTPVRFIETAESVLWASWTYEPGFFRTGRSGGSGDGVHGGGGAHVAAQLVPVRRHKAAHLEGPVPVPSPPQAPKWTRVLKLDSLGSPWTAA